MESLESQSEDVSNINLLQNLENKVVDLQGQLRIVREQIEKGGVVGVSTADSGSADTSTLVNSPAGTMASVGSGKYYGGRGRGGYVPGGYGGYGNTSGYGGGYGGRGRGGGGRGGYYASNNPYYYQAPAVSGTNKVYVAPNLTAATLATAATTTTITNTNTSVTGSNHAGNSVSDGMSIFEEETTVMNE